MAMELSLHYLTSLVRATVAHLITSTGLRLCIRCYTGFDWIYCASLVVANNAEALYSPLSCAIPGDLRGFVRFEGYNGYAEQFFDSPRT
jgi:hypothetical protein